MSGANEIRAFVAIEPSPAIKEEVETLVAGLARAARGVRWVGAGSLHLTLRFLGNVEPEKFLAISRTVAEGFSLQSPLNLQCRGVGAFPDLNRPRVVWLGLTGEIAGLFELVEELNRRLRNCGIPVDPRPFAAHLTVGRAQKGGKPMGLARAAAQFADWRSTGWAPGEVTLFESRLRPEGALHLAAATGKIQKPN